jgi:hypothetical protein
MRYELGTHYSILPPFHCSPVFHYSKTGQYFTGKAAVFEPGPGDQPFQVPKMCLGPNKRSNRNLKDVFASSHVVLTYLNDAIFMRQVFPQCYTFFTNAG